MRGVPSGEVVDEEVGRRRVWIIRQRVQRVASDGVVRPFGDLRRYRAEPARLRPAVVVGEGDKISVGSRRARVARGGGTGVRLREQHELNGGGDLRQRDLT